jgi:tRNA1(Val) A37 N6-methylase TrmN6
MAGSRDNIFNFYATPDWVSDLIAKHCSLNQRAQIIDLGAGEGSLLKSFAALHPKAHRTAIEIDKNHFRHLRRISHDFHHLDLLSDVIPCSVMRKGFQRTIVSNPPFGKVGLNERVKESLIKHNLIDPQTYSKNARLEAYFLSLALNLSKPGSNIAFIVSANLLYQNLWRTLRNTLITSHKLEKIVLLPTDAYAQAEVESAVIFLRPYQGSVKTVNIFDYRGKSLSKSTCSGTQFVDKFFEELNPSRNRMEELGGILETIYRGRSCSKELKNNKIAHLHSTDINASHSQKISLLSKNYVGNFPQEKMAQEGDILIARVGTRCLGSAVMIESGNSVISDCVISVRVPNDKREDIFKKLTSDEGRDWLRSTARGSCAKIITYDSIQRFPIGAI